ncbi:acyltransferase family protein [Sphingopyxis sp. OPL5]|uniref:acyltransferase family protein n=1 Tax=Sphingopyxis sp. OPL5 TaxID=2486273 RepID=UPI00164D9B27|nr:acyltransferase family protein [Sphingopyxis sp. OPL5]QNO26108.1 acyltransferase family protein [Sphingopyxis sp. OPL5]
MSTQRHYGMDWLRIGAFGLLILYHIGMYFVPWGWHVKIAQPLDWVAIPMLATNSWRLALLFLVSGYASAALFAKLGGPGGFAKSRSARLLIPLVFGMAVIVPPQPWIDLKGQHGYPHGFLYFWLHDYFGFRFIDGIALPTWQHLWFVVYLWVYTMLAALLLALIPAAARARIADGAAHLLGGWRLLVVPAFWWIALYLAFPDHDETHALFDDGPSHLHYLAAFGIGWLLRVRPILFEAVARWWKVALVVGLLAFVPVAWVEGTWPGDTVAPDWVFLPYHVARNINGWLVIVALVGIADRWWNRDHPKRAMLAEAVFPFYIIHQTIIVVVGWWLLQAGVGALPSFLVLLAATVTGCWLFYRIGRSITWLRPLIGLQRR